MDACDMDVKRILCLKALQQKIPNQSKTSLFFCGLGALVDAGGRAWWQLLFAQGSWEGAAIESCCE